MCHGGAEEQCKAGRRGLTRGGAGKGGKETKGRRGKHGRGNRGRREEGKRPPGTETHRQKAGKRKETTQPAALLRARAETTRGSQPAGIPASLPAFPDHHRSSLSRGEEHPAGPPVCCRKWAENHNNNKSLDDARSNRSNNTMPDAAVTKDNVALP
ncbi:hypothetical protein PICMEDRAFT_174776 [Pichia membranifaciens NRRL Y-2026]|uniref:Uncharacterized protein n=1 Tax=Pichia membranifaciens NRRL Y-2026 TaxID=763406 RepID=A0A1E3NEZ0_9ASCO|nr:hypothetical protein PICMEDRAFT_174776 [Pichia membranifaciens NRRL Y-2026]ODQ44656.1 hypothetical protein PICMEDRAFT_174776 [Pichia membranifaciens NRRL Y-2026]